MNVKIIKDENHTTKMLGTLKFLVAMLFLFVRVNIPSLSRECPEWLSNHRVVY